jgi:hypothetical protein
MNKLKNSIDKININSNEKAKILDNIMNNKEKNKGFKYKKFIMTFCTFILVFSLCIGTGYALTKYFKLDNKVKDFLDLDDETLEQIDGTDLNLEKEFNNKTIKIIQTIVTDYNIYIRLDITGKEELKYLEASYLSEGNYFDKNIVNIIDLDGFIDYSTTEYAKYNSSSFSLLDDAYNNDTLTNSYILNFNYSILPNTENITLRLYFDKDDYNDITFELQKNNTNQKKSIVQKEVKSKNNLILTSNYVSISTDNVIFNYNVNNKEIFDNLEEYGGQFTNYKVNYNDGSSENLYIIISYDQNSDGSYTSIFGYKNNFENLNNIKSITINDTTFEL